MANHLRTEKCLHPCCQNRVAPRLWFCDGHYLQLPHKLTAEISAEKRYCIHERILHTDRLFELRAEAIGVFKTRLAAAAKGATCAA